VLAAAVAARLGEINEADRPASAQQLASKMVGATYQQFDNAAKQVSLALEGSEYVIKSYSDGNTAADDATTLIKRGLIQQQLDAKPEPSPAPGPTPTSDVAADFEKHLDAVAPGKKGTRHLWDPTAPKPEPEPTNA